MTDDEFRQLKRGYRHTGDLTPLYPWLERVVLNVTRNGRMPASFSPTGVWDDEARRDALGDWLVKRLLVRNDVQAAFDFASAPGPFFASLNRSFRHYLINEAPTTELYNLVDRTIQILKSDDRFDEWMIGRPHYGLSRWKNLSPQPEPWRDSHRDLVAHAWSLGEYRIWTFAPGVDRASPILSKHDLLRFLEALFERCEHLLERADIKAVLSGRFGLEEFSPPEGIDDQDLASEADPAAHLEESEIAALALLVIEELTPRQVEALKRRRDGETLEEIAEVLGVSRGTADNELARAGRLVKQFAGDYDARRILEKLLDSLSS